MVVVHAENPQSQRQLHAQAAIAAAVEGGQQGRQVVGLADLCGGGGQCPAAGRPAQVEQRMEAPQSGSHPAAMLGPHSGLKGEGLAMQ